MTDADDMATTRQHTLKEANIQINFEQTLPLQFKYSIMPIFINQYQIWSSFFPLSNQADVYNCNLYSRKCSSEILSYKLPPRPS